MAADVDEADDSSEGISHSHTTRVSIQDGEDLSDSDLQLQDILLKIKPGERTLHLLCI